MSAEYRPRVGTGLSSRTRGASVWHDAAAAVKRFRGQG